MPKNTPEEFWRREKRAPNKRNNAQEWLDAMHEVDLPSQFAAMVMPEDATNFRLSSKLRSYRTLHVIIHKGVYLASQNNMMTVNYHPGTFRSGLMSLSDKQTHNGCMYSTITLGNIVARAWYHRDNRKTQLTALFNTFFDTYDEMFETLAKANDAVTMETMWRLRLGI